MRTRNINRRSFRFIVSFLIGFLILGVVACEKKQRGFSLPGSQLRFETVKFEDSTTLAEIQGVAFTKDQILDKSQVLKDLEQQEKDTKAGLAYLYAKKLISSQKIKVKLPAILTFYIPTSTTSLEKLLLRFGISPTEDIKVEFSPRTEGSLIAQLGSIEIRDSQIDLNHFVFQSIEQRRNREIAQQLSQQLTRVLISKKAKEAGVELQDFLPKEVYRGQDEISDLDIENYAKSISLSEAELTLELKEKLRQNLKERKQSELIEAYVSKNLISDPVRVSFDAGGAKLELDNQFVPVFGYLDAPISLVVFSAASCPDCYQAIFSAVKAVNKFDGYVKMNWIHMPNPDDSMAVLMSESAICAEAQKKSSSLEFMLTFGQTVGQSAEAQFTEWAGRHGMDKDRFHKCIVEGEQKGLLAQHISYAKNLGIISNPTIWINGQMLEGVVHEGAFTKAIQNIIEQEKLSWFQAFLRRIKARFGLE